MSDNGALPEQPFISHLIELRDRLMRSVIAILIIFLALFPFGNDIYVFIAEPLMKVLPPGTSMIATQVASPFLTPFKLAMVTAVFLAMPYLLHQFWAFIAPGLYQHEKRLALPLLASSVVLFYLGAVFAYVVVFPLIFAFLTSAAPQGVAVMTDITHYLDFVLTLFFAFGLAFEVPIATIVLVMAGATTPENLSAKRPYVIVSSFVIGMLLTPPDIISQTLLAVPMWLLFELGLALSRMLVKSRRDTEDVDDADEPVASSSNGKPVYAAASVKPGPAAQRAADAEADMEDEFDRIEREFEALDAADSTPADAKPNSAAEETAARPRSAENANADAIVDAKLEQIAALRATDAYDEARRLLYEVLQEGNSSQVAVARNILAQMDT